MTFRTRLVTRVAREDNETCRPADGSACGGDWTIGARFNPGIHQCWRVHLQVLAAPARPRGRSGPSYYLGAFLEEYRAAQRERVARIDAVARNHLLRAAEARDRHRRTGLAADRRETIAPRIIAVYRTDADPRTLDLSLDPNERPYGSVFGRRPDLTNHGLVGFGRLSTAEAWRSTWSGLSSNTDFIRCAPSVTVPVLLIELTGDQAAFPGDTRSMVDSLGAADLTHVAVRGTDFGGPIAKGEPAGHDLAGHQIRAWLEKRHDLAPPSS